MVAKASWCFFIIYIHEITAYSTELFKKRCGQASFLYCMTKESAKCDLALLFPYPQWSDVEKRSLFPSFSPLQKLNEGPADFCPVSPGAAAYRFPQAQKEERKDKNKTADAVLHFCPAVWIKHVLHLEVGAMVHILFTHQEPQKLLLHSVTFTPHRWTSFSRQGLHLETLQYDIVYTKGMG